MTRLSPGDAAPEFTLPDSDGKLVSLGDYRGRKVIIYFYPAAMTPGCTTQACDFRDSLDALHVAGYAVLGISPDEPAKLARFRERDSLSSRCCPTSTVPCWAATAPTARRRCTARRSPA